MVKDTITIPKGSVVVLGLSGGPDSVYLLHKLMERQRAGELKVIAAHLDHEWRSDSQNDVEFCRSLSKRSNVSFVTQNATSLKFERKKHESLEAYGRRMRRGFLEQVAKEHNADLIALAHHADDQIETFFIRLTRGASLTGLTSMRAREGKYIRPLLDMSKKEIISHLDKHNMSYITDPSNESEEFLRNRIRRKVIPELKSLDERFSANTLKAIDLLQEADNFLHKLTRTTLTTISTKKDGLTLLDCKALVNLERHLQKRVVLAWLISQKVPFSPSAGLLEEIIRFLSSPRGGKHQLDERWGVTKKEHMARILHISN